MAATAFRASPDLRPARPSDLFRHPVFSREPPIERATLARIPNDLQI